MWGWRFRNHSTFSLLAITSGIVALTCIVIVGSAGGRQLDPEDEEDKNDAAHGLGQHITWLPLKEGFEIAEKEDKPLMLIIHKSWCGACRSLKPKIKESKELGELSKKFVMVNVLDDEEPPEELYRPDGGYIPRILFFSPKGELMDDVINTEGNPQYKYYYYDVDGIMTSMNGVVKKLLSPLDDDTNIDQNTKDAKDADENAPEDETTTDTTTASDKSEL
ncbi:Thioredoxin domain-containing protein 12 [Folsomia candida]|uniref:Thioredoxin domain-containing protein 12 n=2 Tax=Folsomia candida TaxID=158441 RepID=A0A226E0R9_FOLCA|nr:Thioredoxin domain-containing protein 12 [Folsomia candida]